MALTVGLVLLVSDSTVLLIRYFSFLAATKASWSLEREGLELLSPLAREQTAPLKERVDEAMSLIQQWQAEGYSWVYMLVVRSVVILFLLAMFAWMGRKPFITLGGHGRLGKVINLFFTLPRRIFETAFPIYVMPFLAAQVSLFLFFLSSSGTHRAICLLTYLNVLHTTVSGGAEAIDYVIASAADSYRRSVYHTSLAFGLLSLLLLSVTSGYITAQISRRRDHPWYMWPIMLLAAQMMITSLIYTIYIVISIAFS